MKKHTESTVMKTYAAWLEKLAMEAVSAADSDGYPVADATVVFKNDDGTYSVCDNGEGVDGLDADGAVRIIVENLSGRDGN
jgi:hypothetical protein